LGSDWATDNTVKEAALIVATEYFDVRWGPKLKGRPVLSSQALEIPRLGLTNRYGQQVDGVPSDFKKATCLYAKASVAGSLYPTPPSGSAKDIKKKKTVVGPITTEVEYQGAATTGTFLSFPLADNYVRSYIYSTGGVVRN
jgi:hypothetical protein